MKEGNKGKIQANQLLSQWRTETFGLFSTVSMQSKLIPTLNQINPVRTIPSHPQVGLKLNGPHQLLVYADDANLLRYNIDVIKKNKF
jgi:hypothetical protein